MSMTGNSPIRTPHGLVSGAVGRKSINCQPMRKISLVALGFGLAVAATPALARPTVVAELFTSQGCSSCVKSGELIDSLSHKPHVLALTFGVDYWDYLGWADTFAKPEFVDRQRAYMKHLAVREVYTPQVVVDGRLQTAATKPDDVDDLVKQAQRAPHDPPEILVNDVRAAVGSGSAPKGGADVWLVRYDPSAQSVLVKRGENHGRTVVEHNVVRELTRLGAWAGRSKVFRLPKSDTDGLKTVILLQAVHGGRVLAVKPAG